MHIQNKLSYLLIAGFVKVHFKIFPSTIKPVLMRCPKSWNFAEMGLGILEKVLEFFVGKVMVTLFSDIDF